MTYNSNSGLFTRNINRGRFKKHSKVGGVIKGNATNKYLRTTIDGERYRIHRLAWFYVTGTMPVREMDIDHINGNGLDNRFVNLRVVARKINSRNCKLSSRNTSGTCGVYQRSSGRWRSHIRVDRKLICLGTFNEKEDAITARRKAEKKYGFTKLHGRR